MTDNKELEKLIDQDYVCEDYGDVTIWTQVKVTVPLKELDELVAIMSMVNNNLMIEDYSDIDVNLKTCYGDLIDEKILNANKDIASVSVFVPSDRSYADDLAYIRQRTAEGGLHAEVELVGVNEEDWANSWKQYYKPIKIGEKYTKAGQRMLDVGTGTGILAICASRLGAEICRAYDIDPTAVRVARENIKDSGLTNVTCDQSDLLKQVSLEGGRYDLVCANIVADIIIRMTPDVGKYMKDDAVLLASGIIAERCDDVIACFERNGFKIVECLTDNDWCGLAVMKA